VRGTFYTNTIEGFWSILKRSIIGQYHHVSGKYLQPYVNECCYKQNNRKNIGLFHSFITSVLTVNST
jgi:hypothetical protein